MSVTEDRSAVRGVFTRGRLACGAMAGVTAWLAGYLVAYVWKAAEVSEALRGVGFVSQLLGGGSVPVWKGVSWLFLNAHFVDVRFPTVAGGSRMVNFVTGGDGPIALVAAPALALAVAGALVAYDRRGSLLDRATAGATVVAGYLPASVAVAFLATHALGDTGAAIAPDPVTGVLLAGLVYPVAFGALGGAATAALD
ncbi:transporter [Halorussus marinus]|uniref:transporter n=1 Tax=Halorussus marinus TaxID=2505976 RepID=UPI0010919374|nr:transporter [Halorussus marinus]